MEGACLQGLRILDHCCDLQIDDPRTPLALWEGVEAEVAGGWAQSMVVRQPFKLTRCEDCPSTCSLQHDRSLCVLLSWQPARQVRVVYLTSNNMYLAGGIIRVEVTIQRFTPECDDFEKLRRVLGVAMPRR